ncbi:MAG TPA: UDP-2,4-diacetamido-2,4,6-trideoxy-beta-L-altropyranose hydrolase [Rhizomicrobium sp.]|nr:UDP-2,4-diacetamido-2,4,6-trideoxy-beta-L-altropyranose hydrolase [Rhizomicrobium sp.]
MRLVFRSDASCEIGTGHVVRCASLAQALRAQRDDILFCCQDLPGNMIAWLQDHGLAVTIVGPDCALETRKAAQDADWLVVDHYGLDAEWELQAKGSARLMALDDLGRKHNCDLLLDQNYANPVHQRYQVPDGCELLLGPAYALVRPEFAARREKSLARPRDGVRRLLVFMGGIDEMNETSKALAGIAKSRHHAAAVDVVIGAANPHRAAVEAACRGLPGARLHVQAQDMAGLMAQADLMLCAGGSANWERCTLGIPALVTILADNQLPIAESLGAAGSHRTLGWHDRLTAADYAAALDAVTPAMLSAMSRVSAAICDGQGIARVADRLKNYGSEP